LVGYATRIRKSRFVRVTSIILVILSITIGLGGLLRAEPAITRVTSNSYQDSFPQIGGSYVVWQAYIDNDWEIFLYDITTGMTTQLTDNDYDELSPRTDSHYVVWQGFQDGEWEIFLWDGTDIKMLSDRSAEDVGPQIANGFVVWTSEPFGDDFVGPSEIILYDAGAQMTTVLSASVDPDNTLNDSAPRINNKAVIWAQGCSQCDTAEYMYDLSDGTITKDPDYVWRGNPQADGRLRVLTRLCGNDREIFVYNSDSGRYHQMTNNSVQDRCPSISGGYIVWMTGEGATSEIYLTSCADAVAATDTVAKSTAESDTSADLGSDSTSGSAGPCFIDSLADSLGW
jgi:TolB protein